MAQCAVGVTAVACIGVFYGVFVDVGRKECARGSEALHGRAYKVQRCGESPRGTFDSGAPSSGSGPS